MDMRRNKNALFVALNAVFLVILIFLAWLLYTKIKSASGLLSEAEADIAAIERQEREFTQAAVDIKTSEASIGAVQKTFIGENDFVNFVKLLENLSDKSGSAFKAENAQLPASASAPASILFQIDGSYAEIFNFLTLLDHIPYPGIIDNFSINPKKGRVLEARVDYLIFNFKQK